MRQFKFRTPVGSIRAEDVTGLNKTASPNPIYKATVNYGKNLTIQSADTFSFPKQTFNGYLSKYYQHSLNSSPSLTGPIFKVFLDDQQINTLGQVNFRIPNGETWVTIDTQGNLTFVDPGSGTSLSAVVRANFGEYFVEETITFVRDATSPLNALTLALSADRFVFDDFGQPTPSSQTITITPTGTNTTAPITLSAVDNLGNTVPINGSNQIVIASLYNSTLLAWIMVTATDANGVTQKAKIIVQKGTDQIAGTSIDALAAAASSITVYYQNSPPTGAGVDDLWYDLDDANKVYRWTGSAWVPVYDTRIADALTQAAGAQATADGKIKTFFSTSAPTATAIGDLWYNPTTKVLYRWDGTNWSTQVGTWGADWIASLSSIPGNLATLVGTENINNQLVLNSIANDNVLSIQEKIGPLEKLWRDLEARYQDLLTRATFIGLSTTAMTTWRNGYQALLNGYSPAWNNYAVDTTIYTPFFGDENFPTSWNQDGTGLSAIVSGAYIAVGDAATTGNISNYYRDIACPPSTQFSAGVVVKKDATATNRTGMLRILFYGGATNKYFDVIFRYTDGTITSASGSHAADGYASYDLGDEILIVVAHTSLSTNNAVRVGLYPAAGDFTGSVNTANVGTINIRGAPMLVQGWVDKLGRAILLAYQYRFGAEMAIIARQISETDGATTDWVDGPATANVNYDNAGTTIESNVDLDYVMKGAAGTVYTSGVTAKYQVLEGNVNGNAAGSSEVTLTVTSGIATLTVSAMTTSSAKIAVKMTRNGLTKTTTVSLAKVLAAAVPPGSGGGGGSGDVPSQTSGFTSINTATFTTITSSLTFTLPSGKTTLRCVVNLTCKVMPKTANQSGPWNVQFKVLRGGVDQGTAQDSNPDPYLDSDGDTGIMFSSPGTMYYQLDMTGLSALTQYTVTVQARISSGTLPTTPSGVGMNFGGSVTLSAP